MGLESINHKPNISIQRKGHKVLFLFTEKDVDQRS
jgi:hypothetical protein